MHKQPNDYVLGHQSTRKKYMYPSIFFLRHQVECGRWYEALMRGTFASLLNASSFPKFWPQEGPIMPLDLLESAPP